MDVDYYAAKRKITNCLKILKSEDVGMGQALCSPCYQLSFSFTNLWRKHA